MKRTIALALVLAAIALVSIACSSEEEAVPVKLALDWYPNANHLGLFIAQQKGYFEDEGLDVTMYTPSDPSTVLQTVASGSDNFGMNYQPDVILARNEGVPVVSIAAVVQHPLNSVMALESSGISTTFTTCWQEGRLPGHSHERTPARHDAQGRRCRWWARRG